MFAGHRWGRCHGEPDYPWPKRGTKSDARSFPALAGNLRQFLVAREEAGDADPVAVVRASLEAFYADPFTVQACHDHTTFVKHFHTKWRARGVEVARRDEAERREYERSDRIVAERAAAERDQAKADPEDIERCLATMREGAKRASRKAAAGRASA